jgi:predicted polyphosphate/ATP-dependent NAD kinase
MAEYDPKRAARVDLKLRKHKNDKKLSKRDMLDFDEDKEDNSFKRKNRSNKNVKE